ncbi:MAG: hypothetical protein P8Q36_05230 [Alphaproteobacteria bacterium]|nr:hypothetical protein [Alphaproteobacteria bacterium]
MGFQPQVERRVAGLLRTQIVDCLAEIVQHVTADQALIAELLELAVCDTTDHTRQKPFLEGCAVVRVLRFHCRKTAPGYGVTSRDRLSQHGQIVIADQGRHGRQGVVSDVFHRRGHRLQHLETIGQLAGQCERKTQMALNELCGPQPPTVAGKSLRCGFIGLIAAASDRVEKIAGMGQKLARYTGRDDTIVEPVEVNLVFVTGQHG